MPYRHTHRERHGENLRLHRSSRVPDPAALLGALALLLAGCGLKGPLYLPEGRDQAAAPAPAESAAATQDPAATDARKRVIALPPAPQSQKDAARGDQAAERTEAPRSAPEEPASSPAPQRGEQIPAGSARPGT